MARFEFTMVSDAMLQGLAEARATGAEMRAYILLVRGLPRDRSNAECWMPADMAEAKEVMSAAMFTKAVSSLSRKAFTTVDGVPQTVLTKITRGCRGHCPHYEDTLGRLIAEGAYPPPIASPTGAPKDGPIASPKQAPIGEFSTLECITKTGQLEYQNEAIASPTGAPIETIQDIQVSRGAALPPAKQSSAAPQPQQTFRETPSLVTVGEPPRASAGAARGRPAAALPTRQEYDRIQRKLEREGLDAVTPGERAAYHAGHAAYAAT